MAKITPATRISPVGKISRIESGRIGAYKTREDILREQQQAELRRQQLLEQQKLKAQQEAEAKALQEQKDYEYKVENVQRNIREIMSRDPYLTSSVSKRQITELLSSVGMRKEASKIIKEANVQFDIAGRSAEASKQVQLAKIGGEVKGYRIEYKEGKPVSTTLRVSQEPSMVELEKVDTKTYNVLEAVPEPKGRIEKVERYFEKQRAELTTKKGRGEDISFGEKLTGGLFAGAVTSLIGTGRYAKELVTSPVETTKQTTTSTYEFGKGFVTGKTYPEIGRILRDEPEFATGFVLTEALTLKGTEAAPKLVTKGTDIIRTRGLTEVTKESVIAPEYFKGQRYPQIKKGQTAGQLLEEFKIEGAGFTAAPKPFKKETIALRGTSELPGIYQAPKISPTFLRVTGEADKKLFSFNVFDTLRPSTMKITPTSFELIPGVSKAQREIVSGKKAKMFYETTAEKGKSYIPFMKTEKEAVIPFGTKLKKTGAKSYFKFEGRRIPIYEFETAGEEVIKSTSKIGKVEDFSTSYSRGLKQESVFKPTNIFSLGEYKRSKQDLSYRETYKPITTSRVPLKYSSVKYSPISSYKPSPSKSQVTPYISKSITKPSKITTSYSSKSLLTPSRASSILKSTSVSKRLIPTKPKPTKLFIPTKPITPKTSKPQIIKQKKSQFWDIYTKRKGKWFVAGRVKGTSRRALEFGESITQRTLGASFRIKKVGEEDFKKLKFLGERFRYGKKKGKTKDYFTAIQKEQFRLSSPFETSEIQKERIKKQFLY